MALDISALPQISWRVSDAPVDYLEAVAEMERLVEAIRLGAAPETVWLLEHPPLYTAGTSAKADDVRAPGGLPVFPTGRGGQVTWHGPGQRVAYVMLDLRRRGGDVRGFVRALEAWLIAALARFNVGGERREGRVGIWVDRGPAAAIGAAAGARREDKIAAIGVRVRHWVTFHGVSLNVDCDLAAYRGIVPCGVSGPEFGVTSLLDLGIIAPMPAVDAALMATFDAALGFPPPPPGGRERAS